MPLRLHITNRSRLRPNVLRPAPAFPPISQQSVTGSADYDFVPVASVLNRGPASVVVGDEPQSRADLHGWRVRGDVLRRSRKNRRLQLPQVAEGPTRRATPVIRPESRHWSA